MLCCVLHQLCEKMTHFVCLRTSNTQLVERDRNDASVVFDLANSTSEDIADGVRIAMGVLRLCVAEHEKALSVTGHTGREVIDSVEEGKTICVPLFCLKCVDSFELAVDERLVTPSEVHVRIREAALQRGDVVPEAGGACTNCAKARCNGTELGVLKLN